jgi:plastocyanin
MQSPPAPASAAPLAAAPAGETPAAAPAGGKATAAVREATVSGTVRAKDASVGELYVYVDGLRGGPAHPPTVEIKQKDRRFSPAVSVVPVNTRVLFPNVDKVFHNVFSVTPGAAFDLGTVKAGEKSSPTLLAKPGHVEVFCNIHSKMRADILVVPNTHWARVRADGTFQLPGVPVGSYRLVLWGPTVKPAAQRIDIAGTGTVTASFTAEPAPPARHMNKQGAEYGSYDD